MADWLAVLQVLSLLCLSSSPRKKDIIRSSLREAYLSTGWSPLIFYSWISTFRPNACTPFWSATTRAINFDYVFGIYQAHASVLRTEICLNSGQPILWTSFPTFPVLIVNMSLSAFCTRISQPLVRRKGLPNRASVLTTRSTCWCLICQCSETWIVRVAWGNLAAWDVFWSFCVGGADGEGG